MNVRIVVPRRADRGHRDRLWGFCRPRWEAAFPDWPIIEGHHTEGPWNRSTAINRAAEGDWDVLVVLDADVIVDPAAIREAVDLAATSGKMVVPFSERRLFSAAGTRRLLDEGYDADWKPLTTLDRYAGFSSHANVVPRGLWDEVGGMDERFVGWGGDDDALTAACAALAGIERLPGVVWHLHHTFDPSRQYALDMARLKKPDPGYRQSDLLAARYRATTDRAAMRRLLDEPRTDDQVVVVCLTNGKRDTLAKTVHSADEMLVGPIARRVIVGDGCAPEYDGWDTVKVRGGTYMKAVAAGWDVAIGSGQPWVFWLEDDWTFPRPVDLAAMQATFAAEPRLVQMVLMRQAWYPGEEEAGGVIGLRRSRGQDFRPRDGWVQHANYWAMNPMLCRRAFMAGQVWPQRAGSENWFHRQLVDSDAWPVYGIWGAEHDLPRAIHIGVERAGKSNGY